MKITAKFIGIDKRKCEVGENKIFQNKSMTK